MDKDRIIKHLNHLQVLLIKETAFLEKHKSHPALTNIKLGEIEKNIEYYKAEMKDIEDLIKSLETM